MSKQLECIVTRDGLAKVTAYAIDRSRSTISPTDDTFVLWVDCPDENSVEAKAVMAAARKLDKPSSQNKKALVEALTKHTDTDESTATDLAQAIADGVEAARRRANKNSK